MVQTDKVFFFFYKHKNGRLRPLRGKICCSAPARAIDNLDSSSFLLKLKYFVGID